MMLVSMLHETRPHAILRSRWFEAVHNWHRMRVDTDLGLPGLSHYKVDRHGQGRIDLICEGTSLPATVSCSPSFRPEVCTSTAVGALIFDKSNAYECGKFIGNGCPDLPKR